MTGAWSHPPLGRVASLSAIGPVGAKLGEHNGESRFVARLRKYPDWLYKEYSSVATAQESERLDRLIGLPGQMTPGDLARAESHTSWPAVRVVNDRHETTGVLMPLAPGNYETDVQLPGGRFRRMMLLVDQLAMPIAEQERILPGQSLADRIAVCASIAAVGELFERYRLVYLDWSYANVFWSLADHSCYVIDMDGSSFGPRPQIESPNWADPLVPRGNHAGNESDRYRVALLIARCLTGVRGDPAATRAALNGLRQHSEPVEQLAELLIWSITAQSTRERPSVEKLSRALHAANGQTAPSPGAQAGYVKGWTQVGPARTTAPRQTVPPPRTTPPAATPKPAPASRPAGSYRAPAGRTNASASRQSRQPARQSSGPSAGAVVTTILVIIAIIVLLAIIL